MWRSILSYLAIASLSTSVLAQAYPEKTIKVVVPFPPGGGVDFVGRTVATELQEILKASVVVENRAGATGTIGTAFVARAPTDGYTLLVASPGSTTIAGATGRKLGYDVLKDLKAVALAGWPASILVVPESSSYKRVADLVAAAKASPGKLTFGSSGSGNSQHLAGEMLNQAAGIETLHVPYQGTGPALTAILSGQVDFFFCDPACLPLIQSGKLRALAVSGKTRSTAMPSLPTIGETVHGYAYQNWYGFMVPAQTPPEIIYKLNAAIDQALQVPTVKEKMAKAGMDIAPLTPADFSKFLAEDLQRWEQVIRVGKIKFE